ncbi:hypothetical protein V7087_07550, partial [Neobacillus niacini]|uniref:hypothetical protein n=1 Tax=Neobacillus niacini TaxID=86668 RepID=UPI002FFEDA7D
TGHYWLSKGAIATLCAFPTPGELRSDSKELLQNIWIIVRHSHRRFEGLGYRVTLQEPEAS